jgi:hypothetical protein
METERERARDAAVAAVAALGDERSRSAAIGEPLLVRAPDGSPESWFVPLVDGTELVGFVQLGLDLALRRISSLPAPAASWLDPAVVVRVARRVARDDERLGEPVLSYDSSPDRLAWAVPVEGGGTVFVTGDYAWRG